MRTYVGKSAGHQLASPADLPTKASQLANGPCRLVISRQIQPTHSSTVCAMVCNVTTGTTRRGGADDVVQGSLASVARALEEEPYQVPALVPTRVLRQARPTSAVQEQLEGSPGGLPSLFF